MGKVIDWMDRAIYTIGHSNHSREKFMRLLTKYEIKVLVDIRSNPGSHWVDYANPHDLKQILEASGIQYRWLGDLLGGRRHVRDKLFQKGIDQVLGLLETLREGHVCLMCAEEDPSSCHRTWLVGKALLVGHVAKINDIRGDGRLEEAAIQLSMEGW